MEKEINEKYLSKSGIKMLLSMKSNGDCENSNKNFDEDYYLDNEDYIEEITDEEYDKNINEMDDLIRNILSTKQKLRLGKLKSKIKTQEDLLKFMKIRDKQDNFISPEPSKSSLLYIDKIKINPNSKSNNEFDVIKEKLRKQQEMMSNSKLENDPIVSTNNSKLFLTTGKMVDKQVKNKKRTAQSDDVYSLFDEIKQADLRFDDLIDDIDECIKLGEDIDKIIDTKYN